MRGIVGQKTFDGIANRSAQIEELAVEVLPAGQLKTAYRYVHQHLFKARRVGHRDDHDLAAQSASRLQLGQALLEVPGHQHAGQFIGMQGRLDVDLALWLRWPVMKAMDESFSTRHRGQQRVDLMSLCAHKKILENG